MGAVLQTAGVAELAAELTCCACSSICGLAARDQATRAKFRYCSFLLLATATCVIALVPGLRAKLDKIPNLCSKVFTPDTCDKFVGFSVVYRILFTMAIFHLILSVATVKITRVKSFRAKFNNGLWIFKAGLIFGLTIATFYIPKRTGFFRVLMYLSMTGGFMFVVFQIVLVIDFGHSWSLSWADKLESGNTRLWYCAMGLTTIFIFALSFGAILSFYTFFTHPTSLPKCHANFFYISFMSIQCIIATVVSVTPSVQNQLPGTGLLQSSVVILYTMYLTWNTLSSEPDSLCNPLGNVILEYDSFTGLSGEAIFGCLLTLALLIFACTVRASTSHLSKYGLALAESEQFALATYYEDCSKEKFEKQLEDGNKEVLLSEYVGYNYSFFHMIMSLASLHILMVLTNWHSPEENSNLKTLVKNWVSVWVQMASSFACVMLYIWFLVTPLVKNVWGPVFGVELNETTEKLHTLKNSVNLLQRSNTKQDNHDQVVKEAEKKHDRRLNHNAPSTESPVKLPPNINAETIHATKNFSLSENKISRDSQQSLNIQSSFYLKDNKHRLKPRLEYDNIDKDDNHRRKETFSYENSVHNRKKMTKRRFSQYDNMESSIESINSWVSHSYRRNYKPLNNNRKHDSLTAHGLAPINDASSSVGGMSAQHVAEQKPSVSTTIEKPPSNHIAESFTTNNISDNFSTLQKNNKTRKSQNSSERLQHRHIRYKNRSFTTNNTTHSREKIDNSRNMSPFKRTTNKNYTMRSQSDDNNENDSSDYEENKTPQRRKKRRKRKSSTATLEHQTERKPTQRLKKNDTSKSFRQFNDSKSTTSIHRKQILEIHPMLATTSTLKNQIEPHCVYNNSKNKTSVVSSSASYLSKKNRSSDSLYIKIKRQNSDECQESVHKRLTRRNRASFGKDNIIRPELSKESVFENEGIASDYKRTSLVDKKREVAIKNPSGNNSKSKVKNDATQDISIVPSVFKRKPQDTKTADELLRLQWKILRTQAKIVKIQERIFRLQSDLDDQSRNSN